MIQSSNSRSVHLWKRPAFMSLQLHIPGGSSSRPASASICNRALRTGPRVCKPLSAAVELYAVNVDIDDGAQKKRILNSISFSAHAGQLHMLIGPNGCGKSTLLRTIGGLLKHSHGDVRVDGPCAFVFQNPDHQVVMPTVASEVAFGTSHSALSQAELVPRVRSALEKLHMWQLAEASTSTLSGGQKQRLAIASALAQGPPAPRVLLLDELTTFLDAEDAQTVLKVVREVVSKDGSVTAIWVTHRMEELPFADHVTYMEDGKIVMSGTPGKIFRHLKSLGAALPDLS